MTVTVHKKCQESSNDVDRNGDKPILPGVGGIETVMFSVPTQASMQPKFDLFYQCIEQTDPTPRSIPIRLQKTDRSVPISVDCIVPIGQNIYTTTLPVKPVREVSFVHCAHLIRGNVLDSCENRVKRFYDFRLLCAGLWPLWLPFQVAYNFGKEKNPFMGSGQVEYYPRFQGSR